jgi:hypothetical protein
MLPWMKAFALSAVAVFAPVKAVLLSVFFLVLMDAVTGCWAAYKRGERITSAGLRRSLSKLLVFQIVILAAHVLEKYLIPGLGVPVVSLIAGVVGVVEGKSILENAGTIANTDIFKAVIARLGSRNDSQVPKGEPKPGE